MSIDDNHYKLYMYIQSCIQTNCADYVLGFLYHLNDLISHHYTFHVNVTSIHYQ